MRAFGPARWRGGRGFTLIELLAVLSLIVILTGAVGYALLGGGGSPTGTAERLAGAVFTGARNQALLRGAPARVLIHADLAEPDRYLRQVAVVYWEPGNAQEGRSAGWVSPGITETLPRNVFFVPEVALAEGTRPPETLRLPALSAEPQTEGSGTMYFYFEYRPDGMLGDRYAGAQVVFEPGSLEARASGWAVTPKFAEAARRRQTWSGFLLLRPGGRLHFPEAEAIRP